MARWLRRRWARFRDNRLPFWLAYRLAQRRGQMDELREWEWRRAWHEHMKRRPVADTEARER